MRALLAIVVVAAVMPAAVSAGTGQPRLRIVSSSPLMIRGSGFGATERVKVVVSVGTKTASRSLYASASGLFTARFAGLAYDRCHGALKVDAFGARGHHVSFEIQPLDCPDSAGG